MKKLYIILFILVVLILSGCGNVDSQGNIIPIPTTNFTGFTGPTGATGDTGATGATGATANVTSSAIQFIRSGSAFSGDVSYTGMGFKPTSIIVFAGEDTLYNLSFGFANNSSSGMGTSYNGAGAKYYQNGNYFISATDLTGNFQRAVLKSFDSDGITLTWTQTGSPTYSNVIGTIVGFK